MIWQSWLPAVGAGCEGIFCPSLWPVIVGSRKRPASEVCELSALRYRLLPGALVLGAGWLMKRPRVQNSKAWILRAPVSAAIPTFTPFGHPADWNLRALGCSRRLPAGSIRYRWFWLTAQEQPLWFRRCETGWRDTG